MAALTTRWLRTFSNLTLVGLLCIALGLGACTKSKTTIPTQETSLAGSKSSEEESKDRQSPTKSAVPDPASSAPPKASTAGDERVDQDIVRAVELILERCTIEEDTGWVRGCPQRKQLVEVEKLRAMIDGKGLLSVLPTMAYLLTKGEDKQRNFITAELDTTFARKFPPPHFLREVQQEGKTIDAETAKQLSHRSPGGCPAFRYRSMTQRSFGHTS